MVGVGDMFVLCNQYQWFTAGSNNQYNKLFEMVTNGRGASDLALVIYVCSEGWSEKDIYDILVKNGFSK